MAVSWLCFNPLLIGELIQTLAVILLMAALTTNVSIPFSSGNSFRPTEAIYRPLKPASAAFQSPSHRGTHSDSEYSIYANYPEVFQSPSHRGTHSDLRKASGMIKRQWVSIPFSSGNSFRPFICRYATRVYRQSFNPLLIGELIQTLLPQQRQPRSSIHVSIPFSSGNSFRHRT